jgi:hypothetical protein
VADRLPISQSRGIRKQHRRWTASYGPMAIPSRLTVETALIGGVHTESTPDDEKPIDWTATTGRRRQDDAATSPLPHVGPARVDINDNVITQARNQRGKTPSLSGDMRPSRHRRITLPQLIVTTDASRWLSLSAADSSCRFQESGLIHSSSCNGARFL